MTEIRHIVFDIGRVLVHYDPHLAFEALIPERTAREAFFAEVCTHDWNIEQDRGRGWAEAEAEAIARHPDKAELIRAFRLRHTMMISHAYDESVAILRALIAADRDVTMLTNFASDTFRETQARFPFLSESRGVTVSGDIRLIKPDRAIFDHHAETFGLTPAATLFIDDSAANVAGAQEAGWQAVLFTSAAQLRADLESRGISVP